ncbi:Kef-type K+ transport system, membrane component [Mycolicibacterium chubuense NBB4]|uniref:Kef-type K+ transport system, membrane component n=1 Tax=Mycolicibacterium chubuense (strain NBB4) TaxID=710421 RepID=I4BQF3_MYCCN|nr:cation:proton antiporter [Mycolicibacterium chubuense]AFM19510.1 Kef-type K+ transport system, membrane component [Mycolicibacterium chubuense NBB4]
MAVSGFGFATLALIVVIGMAGPLIASVGRFGIPAVIGELAAGIAFGSSGLRIVDHTDPVFTLLADIGFALVMFVAGTHVPVRDASLRTALPAAAVRAVLAGLGAAVLAVVLAQVFGTGHALLYAVLMASSSAALALPVIDSLGLTGPPVLSVTAQIAIADTAAIVLLPLAIAPSQAGRASLGVLAVFGCAAVVYGLLRVADRRGWRRRAHRFTERYRVALELRVSLMLLFALCALAVTTRISIMLAGFALGLVVAAVGQPRRLARQLFGVTEGFFGPLFFVWLGASLNIGALGTNPKLIALGVALGLGAVLAHTAGRMLGQPVPLAVLSAAQLGVPVAAATLGSDRKILTAGEPAALILGALVTVVAAAVAAAVLRRRQQAAPT